MMDKSELYATRAKLDSVRLMLQVFWSAGILVVLQATKGFDKSKCCDVLSVYTKHQIRDRKWITTEYLKNKKDLIFTVRI
jgi:hypothetical protein